MYKRCRARCKPLRSFVVTRKAWQATEEVSVSTTFAHQTACSAFSAALPAWQSLPCIKGWALLGKVPVWFYCFIDCSGFRSPLTSREAVQRMLHAATCTGNAQRRRLANLLNLTGSTTEQCSTRPFQVLFAPIHPFRQISATRCNQVGGAAAVDLRCMHIPCHMCYHGLHLAEDGRGTPSRRVVVRTRREKRISSSRIDGPLSDVAPKVVELGLADEVADELPRCTRLYGDHVEVRH